MYNLQVLTAILLIGLSLVHGFFQSIQDHFLLQNEQSAFSYTSAIPKDLENTIEQRVDHFNDSNTRTWNQTYYKPQNSWKPGGPIVLLLVGDGCWPYFYDLNSKDFFLNEIVQETNGAYFILEPRFYRNNRPFARLSKEHMKFLTSRQSLADIAHLLKTLKESPEFKNSKVILAGGFYGGSLAVWARVLYPELIDAVVSSSAPVLAKKDFSEYLETVTDVYKTYGSQECVDKIAAKFSYLEELFQTPEGIEKLKKEYNICKKNNMSIPENQQLFLAQQIIPYVYTTIYGGPTNVSLLCQNNRLIEQGHQFSIVPNYLGCYIYDFDLALILALGFITDMAPRLYQSCTEYGFFQTTSSSNQMFGNAVPIDFYFKMCSTVLGDDFNEESLDQGIIRTNQMFGGLTPNVTNVVFVNEDMSPWRGLEVMQDLSPDATVVKINGETRVCKEYFKHPTDSDKVREARKKIKELVKKIIGQG